MSIFSYKNKFNLKFIIISLILFFNSINLAFGSSVVSSKNNLDEIIELDTNLVVIVGVSNGQENFFETEILNLENLVKYSLGQNNTLEQSNQNSSLYNKTLKIYELVSNFDNSLTNVKAYSQEGSSKFYINKNEEVILLEIIENWLKILYDGDELYINSDEIQSSDTEYAKVISNTGLNFRTKPSTSSEIITTLPFGEVVEVIEVLDDWFKVKISSGEVGYLSNEYLEIIQVSQEKPIKQEYFTQNATEVIQYAMQFLGSPYVYGGMDLETGTDCSGFTHLIFKNFGIELNRTARDQYLNGTYVEKEDLQPGDLVFFSYGDENSISHIGIYIGNNEYIHSADQENGVIISSLGNPFSVKYYFGARRVL